MPGKSKDFGSVTIARELVKSSVLGVTNAGTDSVDLGLTRQGYLIISLDEGTDVVSDVVLQDSADDVTFATILEVDDADVDSDAFVTYDVPNIRRYARMTWTRAGVAGDSNWSVVLLGSLMVRAPFGT